MIDALSKWSEGKPVLLAAFAQMAVFAAEDIYKLLQLVITESSQLRGSRRSEGTEWLRLYGKHRELRRGLLVAVGTGAKRIVQYENMLDFFGWMSRANPKQVTELFQSVTQTQWERAMRNVLRLSNWFTRTHRRELAGSPGNGFFVKTDGQQVMASLPFRFFMRVAFPCWFLYGKWPSQMLYEATRLKRTNWKSLENLVRLDKHVVNHPRIVWMLNCAPHTIRQFARNHISKSINSHPKNISRKNVKYRIGRLIARISERFGYRLLEPEIRKLFNIAARNRHELLSDTNLPLGSETFSKALQREPNFWFLPLKPDTQTLKRVRALRG